MVEDVVQREDISRGASCLMEGEASVVTGDEEEGAAFLEYVKGRKGPEGKEGKKDSVFFFH